MMKKTIIILLINCVIASALSILCIGLFAKNLPFNVSPKQNIPLTGFISQEVQDFDNKLVKFLSSHGFDGATLAIIKDGNFLAKRGYGWSDKNKTKLMQPDDFLRLASLSKIFTAIAIKKLIANKKLSYDTPVLNFLGITKEIHDPNLQKATVLNLLLHQGGWHNNRSLDPLFSLGIVAPKLNKDIKNITPTDMVRYTVEHTKLDFIPGSDMQYSNIGFTILGRVIEKAMKANYVQAINTLICKPENIKVALGPDKLSGQSPYEIEFYQSHDVDLDDDSISLKAADSTFGLITSAPNLCKILNTYWLDGDKKSSHEQRQLTATGTLPGSTAIARQRYSGASIVVLINSRDNNNAEMDNITLLQLIDNTANKCGI